jgi:hypothetical protein
LVVLNLEINERANYNPSAAGLSSGKARRRLDITKSSGLGYDLKIDYDLERLPDGSERRIKHYYVNESVGIACGMLLAALHNAGLTTLTHTPNPMGFLSEILKRPKNEKPYLLVPVGYPADGAKIPNITKKSLNEIMRVIE